MTIYSAHKQSFARRNRSTQQSRESKFRLPSAIQTITKLVQVTLQMNWQRCKTSKRATANTQCTKTRQCTL